MNFEEFKQRYTVTQDEVRELFQPRLHSEHVAKIFFALLGILLTPITLAGTLLGYVYGFERVMEPRDEPPVLFGLRPIVRVAMITGAVLIWVAIILGIFLLYHLIRWINIPASVVMGFIVLNLMLSLAIYAVFTRWRNIKASMHGALVTAADKFGSARWATSDDLREYKGKDGIYLGGGYTFADKGHILTCAGTRGGKGTSLIVTNLLGLGNFPGSWVVIDPKGENAAITSRYQRESGKQVVILNPWELLPNNLGNSTSYNPLDILSDKTSIHLIDDAQIIAEMLVPIDRNDKDKFFTDNARSIVAGMLVHLVTIQPDGGDKQEAGSFAPPVGTDLSDEEADKLPPPCTLKTLWQWVRMSRDEWEDLLADMAVNDDPTSGEIVRRCANEILALVAAGEKTFGNIMATILQCTDFLKSPALQKSLQSGFDPKTLSDGNTTLYVIIPADKLLSHARWLRLIVTTALKAVVRKPKEKVCFLLDEFAALGYLSEIETALSTYAGFNITVWPILQSLIQLKGIYSDKWETFIGNTAVRHYFSINDNFTAEYVSNAIGKTSHMIISRTMMGKIRGVSSNERMLATPDEVRRYSGQSIFAFMGEKPATIYAKYPYHYMPDLIPRADPNPYL